LSLVVKRADPQSILLLASLLIDHSIFEISAYSGTAIALAGVFLYSQLKRLQPKPKAA
jgi:hypothetical protein